MEYLRIIYFISVLGAVAFFTLMHNSIRSSLLSNVVKNRLRKGMHLRFRWAIRNEMLLITLMTLGVLIPLCNTFVASIFIKMTYKAIKKICFSH